MDSSVRDTIARVAREEGVDPSYALAVAERESSFNPNAHSSKTIHGLFQMKGDLRARYGAGDSNDPETQTRAWARFSNDLRGEMAPLLGRQPTDQEIYVGHHFGGARAARILSGQNAGLSPQDVFTPYELSLNPHLNRAAQVGNLSNSIMADIGRRQAKFGGDTSNTPQNRTDFSQFGEAEPREEVDFAQFGAPADDGGNVDLKVNQAAAAKATRPGREIDLSQFGAAASAPTTAGNDTDFSQFGTPPTQVAALTPDNPPGI